MENTTVFQAKLNTFVECALAVRAALGDEGAIAHARKMAADRYDSYELAEGEQATRKAFKQ